LRPKEAQGRGIKTIHLTIVLPSQLLSLPCFAGATWFMNLRIKRSNVKIK